VYLRKGIGIVPMPADAACRLRLTAAQGPGHSSAHPARTLQKSKIEGQASAELHVVSFAVAVAVAP